MPKVEVRLSLSCRLYPPACKPHGLEAQQEASGSILLKEKTRYGYYIHLLISGFAR
jgi:hypothetical protein